mmetsp:Transcript_11627/g.31155  ORF Transcript_11627/g.31155 Transcript_11627/m.31155 type:complete len:318 (+) Transcript_11627:253-1206(+)
MQMGRLRGHPHASQRPAGLDVPVCMPGRDVHSLTRDRLRCYLDQPGRREHGCRCYGQPAAAREYHGHVHPGLLRAAQHHTVVGPAEFLEGAAWLRRRPPRLHVERGGVARSARNDCSARPLVPGTGFRRGPWRVRGGRRRHPGAEGVALRMQSVRRSLEAGPGHRGRGASPRWKAAESAARVVLDLALRHRMRGVVAHGGTFAVSSEVDQAVLPGPGQRFKHQGASWDAAALHVRAAHRDAGAVQPPSHGRWVRLHCSGGVGHAALRAPLFAGLPGGPRPPDFSVASRRLRLRERSFWQRHPGLLLSVLSRGLGPAV